jgi:hypothetical protein
MYRRLFRTSRVKSPDPIANAIHFVRSTARHRKHTAGLIDHDEFGVFVNNVENGMGVENGIGVENGMGIETLSLLENVVSAHLEPRRA